MTGHRSILGWTAPLVLGLLGWGCATAEPEPPQETLRPFVPPPAPLGSDAETDLLLADSNPVRWVARRLSVPLSQSTDDAWSLADEAVLDDLSRAVWNGNGLRVAVMPASRGRLLNDLLGDAIDRRDTQILSYGFPEDVRESPPLRAEFFADLTVPPNPVTLESFTRGRLRMLMASRPLGNGTTRVTLTPQHYLPKVTLRPRTPQERAKDGRVFDELSIELDIARHQVLLLGFYPPPSLAPDAEEEANPDNTPQTPVAPEALPNPVESSEDKPINIDDAGPDDVVNEQLAAEELPPLNLGRGLFTTGISEDDFKLLFIFRPLP